METREPLRRPLLDHVRLVVDDIAAAQKFYASILGALGIPMGGAGDGFFWAGGIFVSTPDNPAAKGVRAWRHHITFEAKDRAMVDAFHKAGLVGGGKDNGAPGGRLSNPDNYAAFLLDPAGNNVEAVFRTESQGSATWDASHVMIGAPEAPGLAIRQP